MFSKSIIPIRIRLRKNHSLDPYDVIKPHVPANQHVQLPVPPILASMLPERFDIPSPSCPITHNQPAIVECFPLLFQFFSRRSAWRRG
jgi:hypothetical protein